MLILTLSTLKDSSSGIRFAEDSMLESMITTAPTILDLRRVVNQSHELREPLYPHVASGTVEHREVEMVKQPPGFWQSVKQYVYAILFD